MQYNNKFYRDKKVLSESEDRPKSIAFDKNLSDLDRDKLIILNWKKV